MPQMVTGAKVSVRGSDGSEYATQEANGYYTCSIDALNPDATYYLRIETDGEVYESEPQKPLPTEKIEEVSGVQNTPESNIDVLVTPEAPVEADKANYYSWTYDETWEVHPDYTTNIYFDTENIDASLMTPTSFLSVDGRMQQARRSWLVQARITKDSTSKAQDVRHDRRR